MEPFEHEMCPKERERTHKLYSDDLILEVRYPTASFGGQDCHQTDEPTNLKFQRCFQPSTSQVKVHGPKVAVHAVGR
jgi:hypothetical protein